MSKPIVMSPGAWDDILEKIKSREKPSVYLCRNKMKTVLGFTVREHSEYQHHLSEHNSFDTASHVFTIRLDFYDEQKRTMFLLRYGNGQT
jgi:hypothetical protein